ncbi:hypothetical protein HPB50_014849 [Hyalomma asiaticum]|uniref:Uncharacterized protein n=1 Tax=Hyalomma asiaticum TaxID=266040 RepID=A0ACB7RJ97_HYAAI|nr:hypothetical protein HPB50_014849 [Hyalomma asiaticum]
MNAPEIAELLRTFEEAQGANSALKHTKRKEVESRSVGVARPDNAPAKRQPHGTVNLTSAFRERVQAKLAVIPLTIARERGEFSGVGEPVPVLCALTDRLTTRTDCLLSEDAWKLLNEECAFEGLVKDASEVGGQTRGFAGEPRHEGTVRQQGDASALEPSGGGHATEEALISEVTVADQFAQRDSSTSPGDTPGVGTTGKSASCVFREKQRVDPTLLEAWVKAASGKMVW